MNFALGVHFSLRLTPTGLINGSQPPFEGHSSTGDIFGIPSPQAWASGRGPHRSVNFSLLTRARALSGQEHFYFFEKQKGISRELGRATSSEENLK